MLFLYIFWQIRSLISRLRCLGKLSERPRIPTSSSFDVVKENLSKASVWGSYLVFSSIILKKETFTSILLNPILQDPSIGMGSANEKASIGLVSLLFRVFCYFVWLCLLSVSKFLVIENNISSVSFFGLNRYRFFKRPPKSGPGCLAFLIVINFHQVTTKGYHFSKKIN